MMPTFDHWHPYHVLVGHPSGLTTGVEVRFLELRPFTIKEKVYPGAWRVCVWGNDDTGMERDFPDDQRDAAMAMYNLITSWETVDRYALTEQGFVYC